MKKILLGLALAATTAIGAANAAPVYPVSVVSYTGPLSSDPTRTTPGNAIGPADGVFFSLGLGGSMVFDFGVGMVQSPGNIKEVTNRLTGYFEKVKVFVSNSLVFSDPAVATISNQVAGLPGGATISFVSLPFRYVKLLDVSDNRTGRDGFDVDSISFSPVPLPAGGLLLGGALFGLGALRRRAKKTA